jgi:arsenate reductase (glutaredoxin)
MFLIYMEKIKRGDWMALTLYWYPKCGTCRKARKWLDDHEISYDEIHIVDNPPSREMLEDMYKRSGLEIKKFFNTSGQRYRDLGLKDRINQASDEELLDLLASDGMLIKRPLVKDDQKVTVGFNEDVFEETWG